MHRYNSIRLGQLRGGLSIIINQYSTIIIIGKLHEARGRQRISLKKNLIPLAQLTYACHPDKKWLAC